MDRLYVAKNFVNYVKLDKTPATENIKVALETLEVVGSLEALLEQRYEKMFPKVDLAKFENYLKESNLTIDSWIVKDFFEFRAEAEQIYNDANKNNSEVVSALKERLDEMHLEHFFLTFQNYIATKMYSLNEEAIKTNNDLQKLREEQEREHNEFLASAGLDTKEGHFAWVVAHFAGLYLQGFVYTGVQDSQRVSKEEVKLTEQELHAHLYDAIVDGLRYTVCEAVIENDDEFATQAKNWLHKEIQQRLATGQEFKLLGVSLRKEKDGLIYLKDALCRELDCEA